MVTVSVLFARRDSVYKTLPGVDVWDEERDARRWPGGTPVVAHPPCRAWGRYAWKAKASAEEKQLARWAVAEVRRWGGVLEHPEHSRLWADQSLPLPGKRDNFGGFTVAVSQKWWGHEAEKPTWLYIVGVEPKHLPVLPFSLHWPATNVERLCRQKRERTPPDLAAWLVSLARAAA